MLTTEWGAYECAGSSKEEEFKIVAKQGEQKNHVWVAFPIEDGVKIVELSGVSDITDDPEVWDPYMGKLSDDMNDEYDVMFSAECGDVKFLMCIDSMDSVGYKANDESSLEINIEQAFEFTDGEYDDERFTEVFSLLELI